MSLSRRIARPMLSSIFVVGAANALRNTSVHAQSAKPVTDRLVPALKKAVPQVPLPEDTESLVRLNAGVQLLAAGALATGRAPRLSSAVLAASLVPTTVAAHRFWEAADTEEKAQQRIHFFKNVSVLGGLLIAAGDTDGSPGVAWRTRRLARDARREVKREAKLLKARAT